MDQIKVKQPLEILHEGDELTRAARRKIDDDISKLERTIRSLKTKRNDLSPISVLPTEVLSKIFILARDWSNEFEFYDHRTPWIIVGHVCHHWRQVALGCPSLWSVPVFIKPHLAQEMMQRSKMAALTIRSAATTWAPRMLEQLKSAMAQTYRIKSIELALCHFQNPQTIFSSLSQPAPLLEKVSFRDITPLMDDYQFSFPTDALSDAPCLRSIDFERLNLSWESAVFRHRNLTELRLRNNYGTSTFGQMMDALYHLPNLRILALNDSIPSHTTSLGNEKILEFKFLEQLELQAEAVDCIFLLRHIQYPPNATVSLRSSFTRVEDSITIFSLIGQNLRHSHSVKAGNPHSPVIIRSAQLTSADLHSPDIAFFDEVNGTKHEPFGAFDPIIAIFLDGDWALGQAHSHLLTGLYNCFDLSELRELLLHWTFTDNEVHAIRDTFGKLPKLEIINMSESLPEICAAIAESPRDSPAEEAQTRYPSRRRKPQDPFPPASIFPALTTLVIEHADFRQDQYPEDAEHLIDMLMKRSDMNLPIDRLRLEYCHGVETHQKRWLGELVVNLEVESDEEDSDDSLSDEDEDGGDGPDADDYFSDDPSD